MTRPLTEGEAFRLLARCFANTRGRDVTFSEGLYALKADRVIGARLHLRMFDRLAEHERRSVTFDPMTNDARSLLALWLAHEAEDAP